MTGSGVRSISNLQYGGLYLPVFSLLIIRSEVEFPHEISISGFGLFTLNDGNFPIIFWLVLLGALVSHYLLMSIFGKRGPLYRPKNKWVTRWYRFALLFTKQPPEYPSNVDEFLDNFFSLFRPVRVIRGFVLGMLRSGYRLFSLMLFVGLYNLVLAGSENHLVWIVFIAMFVFLFAPLFSNRFPTTVPPESAPWINVPEYKKSEILLDDGEIELKRGFEGLSTDILEEVERVEEQREDQSAES